MQAPEFPKPRIGSPIESEVENAKTAPNRLSQIGKAWKLVRTCDLQKVPYATVNATLWVKKNWLHRTEAAERECPIWEKLVQD